MAFGFGRSAREKALDLNDEAIRLIKQGDLARARGLLDKAIALDPRNAVFYSNRATCCQQMKAYRESLDDLERSLELRPNHWPTVGDRGYVRFLAGDAAGALADLDLVLQHTPADTFTLLYRARSLIVLERLQEAYASIEQGLALTPGHHESLLCRGSLRFKLGESLGAVEDFSAILEAERDPAFVLRLRGRAYYSMNDEEHAISDFSRLMELRPDEWEGFAYYGICASSLGRHDEAVASLTRAIALRPDLGPYLSRGLSLEARGQLREALADFDQAIARSTAPEPYAYFCRIRVHRALGDRAAAERDRQTIAGLRDKHVRAVAAAGKFVWGAVLQARSDLYEPGEADMFGRVVFTFQRDVPKLGDFLARIAAVVFSAKGVAITSPEMMILGEMTTKELATTDRQVVPSTLTGGVEVYCGRVFIHRDYLPNHLLDVPFLPVAAELGPVGRQVHLPYSVGEKKKGLLTA